MSELKIELINTGNELLLGTVRDIHLSWLGKELFPLGVRISRQTTVPDGPAIRDALLEAFGRADVLIVTGGLGPTTDDLTRELVSELLGYRLVHHRETLERIQERCRKRGYSFLERMERQAMAPEEAIVLPNENGSAPGLYFPAVEGLSWATPHLFLLPGPPRELQPMAQAHLFPLLKKLAVHTTRHECRVYKVIGMGESQVEARVGLALSKRGDIEVGYCARPNEVDFRLIASKKILDEVEPLVLAAIGDYLDSEKKEPIEAKVIALLKRRGESLSTAESCTGGLLASRITDVPGASAVFLEGFVTYSNASKCKLLAVPSELIVAHGAVSEEVVRAMAEGARQTSGATHAVALTGIAGPDGGSREKPVGTLWIGLSSQGKETEAWKEIIQADRVTFKNLATHLAFERLMVRLASAEGRPTF